VNGNSRNVALRGVQFSLKLGSGADAHEFAHTVASWPGVLKVTQTFPDEPDDDLARLFVLEVEPSTLESVLAKLRRDRSVEYAENPAPRRLIR
jgi:hypothetical protein